MESSIGNPNLLLFNFRSSHLKPQRTAVRLRDKHERQLRRVLALEHNVIRNTSGEQF